MRAADDGAVDQPLGDQATLADLVARLRCTATEDGLVVVAQDDQLVSAYGCSGRWTAVGRAL